MNSWITRVILAALVCSGVFAAAASGYAAGMADEQTAVQADHAFVEAIGKADTAALDRLLDVDFTWIDSNGVSRSKAQVLENLPALKNGEVEIQAGDYGRAAIIRANRGRVQVLRVWAKRPEAWRLVLYQEVTFAAQPERVAAGSSDCENPCRAIPFEPQTESERAAIASWQGVMKAMANNDAGAYAPLIADEFTATDTHHTAALNKSERIAQINKQKQTGTNAAPSPLLSARMFDFGETVMMIAREQRADAKPYINTRMWVQRDGRWQMLFSFNTRIE